MPDQNISLFDKEVNPLVIGAISLCSMILILLIHKLIMLTNLVKVSEYFPWTTVCAFLLLYAIFNSVFTLASSNLNKYWVKSMLVFFGLSVFTVILGTYSTGIPISDAGSYKWLMFVITLGYLVFMSIIGFMKGILDFAQKEDWQSPRKRKK